MSIREKNEGIARVVCEEEKPSMVDMNEPDGGKKETRMGKRQEETLEAERGQSEWILHLVPVIRTVNG